MRVPVQSVTYNAGNAKPERVAADLTRLVRLFLVVCLQEVADRAKLLNATGAQVLQTPGKDRAHVAMLVAAPAQLLTWAYVRCTRRSFVGAWGAGPRTIAAKWILWALVDVEPWVTVTMATTHLVPSAERQEPQGRLARIGWRRRRALYRRHIAAIVAWAAGVQGPIALHMDANADASNELLAPLAAAGFVCQTAPSHGDRAIDQIWTRGCTPEQVQALTGYSSDHRPVAATYVPQEEVPMTRKPDYPKANADVQWFANVPSLAGSTIDPNVVVLHTTESLDWPTYNHSGTAGDSAPHYTARPSITSCLTSWRQHFPETMSSRALRNEAGGVETNTLNAVQVELVGTCDYAHRDTWNGKRAGVDYIYWPAAPEWALRDLAAFLASIHKRRGVKLEAPALWLAYGPDERAPGRRPASYGDSPARMTGKQWSAFYGVCGHQHVPENVHGDPGRLDIARVLELAGAPTPKPTRPSLVSVAREALTKALARAEAKGQAARAAMLRAALAALPGTAK